MRLRITPEADREVKDHAEYLWRESEELGRRFLRRAYATFDRLTESPTLGERLDSPRRKAVGVRRWRVDQFTNHLILYRADRDVLLILRVVHSASDWAWEFGVSE